MPFVDDLAVELFVLSLVGVVSLYMTGMAYVEYRKNGVKNVEKVLRPGAFPLGMLGLFILVMGYYGEMVWPLPGSYNILFGDPFILMGIVITSLAVSLALKQKLQFVGIVAAFSGLISVYYGYHAYIQGMTSEPLAMFGMYLAFGLTGIFTFPATLIYDKFPEKGGKPS
ncbi:MAG TPA: DUF981 domain-containing protein, partial [Thermoplasmataceae archaeon]|nr:DUF981 domain-containing protein [Thermoplasmataceae archaeon]